jgi:hypothetical protein
MPDHRRRVALPTGGMQTFWRLPAGTTCSPSRPTSPPCAPRCAGCPGPPPRDPGGGSGAMAAPSPARSRSSTATGRASRSCFPAPVERSRSSAGAAPPEGSVGRDRLRAYLAGPPRRGPGAVWLRGHWKIENRVHHVRDVTQRENASRIRTGNGPQVMAAFRNTANNIAHLTGHDNIAAAQRAAAWHPHAITDALRAA